METLAANACPEADIGCAPVVSFRQPDPPAEIRPTIREVFATEESPLLRFAYGLVGQRETAEDLVQDAFVKLHAHWDEVTHPRAWLFRCVRNLALSHIRDHKREIPISEDHELQSTSPGPEQTLGKLEAIGTLQLLVAELHEDDRNLISLKYHEGLKYDQISQRTGLSVSNVGYKLHHALKNLADSLRRLGVETIDG
ncbi:RNA polymerase sigma factor [Luteolibacter yonseiensis]|uniref:RNA polymerase sigma factor n=1 Tax=Luteolibacter yonseiensis TaxID=1144680 RepID=A0A934VC07_9BACT|nr:RNA polymerase sigma factor [Luteolibacter yonseiensis]MBK1817823.1 RNA polymerase sigma factor [Luteolibacter yonseiensis]